MEATHLNEGNHTHHKNFEFSKKIEATHTIKLQALHIQQTINTLFCT